MMDGRVSAIRDELDDSGFEQIPILSYASKFSSAFYGPFREAADSAPQFGDRRSYQMDGANLREAMREIELDLVEGADMILMKPAMPYLDVIHAARERFDVPIGAYQVSGEYSMLQAAFARGWLEPKRAMLESLLSIRRAGGRFYCNLLREGYGKLTGPAAGDVHTVDVESGGNHQSIQAKNILLATGSDAKMFPGMTADDRILTNVEMLAIPDIPKSMVIIGAGAVGVEFGSIFASFGSEITIVEYLPRIVPVEDEEISKELARNFRKRGIDCNAGSKFEKVDKTETGVKVTYTSSDGKQVVKEAEKVLIAVGRGPRTEGIGLEKTKIKTDRGFIPVDEWQQTEEPASTRSAISSPAFRNWPTSEPWPAWSRSQRSPASMRGRSSATTFPDARTPSRRSAASALPRRRRKKKATMSRSGNSLSRRTPRPPSSARTKVSSRSLRIRNTARSLACTSSALRRRN